MASSSEWIAMLERGSVSQEAPQGASGRHGWISALTGSQGFVEGLPALHRPAHPTAPAPEPDAFSPPSEPSPDEKALAYAEGEAAARAAALAEYEERSASEAAQQRKLQLALRALDQAGMDALAQTLAEAVTRLCSAAIADYVPEPERLLERCHAAARLLGALPGECALHLHPDDLELLDPDTLSAWAVVADPAVERGGLRFEGPDGAVSDTPEDWRRAIAAAVAQ